MTVVLATVALLAAACGSRTDAGDGATPDTDTEPTAAPPTAPVTVSATHAQFLARDHLPPCDPVVLAQGEAVPPESWTCLDDADDETGAELVVTAPTIEGDPIVTYYRVGPAIAGLEIYVDSTKDAFGDSANPWQYESCPATVAAKRPSGCHR